jgi:Gpi18-like mannosyltransferase
MEHDMPHTSSPPLSPTPARRPRVEQIVPARVAPMLAAMTAWLGRNRWMATPIAIALGVRLSLYVLVDITARLINGPQFAGHMGTWDRYDASAYVYVAEHGYTITPRFGIALANFFPLYPLEIWLLQHVTILFEHQYSYLLAGMISSVAAFVAACVVLYRLALDRFGAATAYGVVLLLATFPFSFYYGAAYTEAPYLLWVLLAFLGIEQRRWWLAALGALLAGATRPPGLIVACCVMLAFALDWLQTRGRLRRDALWLALAPAGTLGYIAFCAVYYGDPLEYLKASGPGHWNGGHLQRMACGRRSATWLIQVN